MEHRAGKEINLPPHPEVASREAVMPVETQTAETFLATLQDKLRHSMGEYRQQDWFRTADGQRLFLTFYSDEWLSQSDLRGGLTLVEREPLDYEDTGIYTVYHVRDAGSGLTIEKDTKIVDGVVRDHGFAGHCGREETAYQLEREIGLSVVSEQEGRGVLDLAAEAEYIWQLDDLL